MYNNNLISPFILFFILSFSLLSTNLLNFFKTLTLVSFSGLSNSSNSSNFSINQFFYKTSSSIVIGEVIIEFLKKEINYDRIKSILVPYEGQPYEHLIFEEARKNNKKLATSFIDYRFKRVDVKNYKKNKNKFINVIKSKVSKKGYLQKIYEDYQIKKYLKKIKN